MSVGSVIFLRHGRTAYNAVMRLQGQVDIPLDAVGTWQAEQGAKALAAAHKATRVVSSDLVRARVTAEHYVAATGQELLVDERMRERSFGVWEGLTREEIEEQWPEPFAQWRRGDQPQGVDVEPRAAVTARVMEVVAEYGADLGPRDTLLLVSHGAAISLGLTGMLGLDPETWHGLNGLHNVHWSHADSSRAGSKAPWRLVAHNVGAGFPLDHWNSGPDWNLEPTSF